MTTVVKGDFTPEGIQTIIDGLRTWEVGTLDPAADYFARGQLAESARATMHEDAHGPEDNPANTGGLKTAIANAAVLGGNAEYEMVVAAFGKTNPAKEMNWGEGMHGSTPAPHDFTRNLDEVVLAAPLMWEAEIKDLL